MQNSYDAVYWAYQFFLNRAPDSNETSLHWLNTTSDARHMVQHLTASPEFKQSSRYKNIFAPQAYLPEFLILQQQNTNASQEAAAWGIRLLLNREPTRTDKMDEWTRYTYVEMLQAILCTDEYQTEKHHDSIFEHYNIAPLSYKTIAFNELPDSCFEYEELKQMQGTVCYYEHDEKSLCNIQIKSFSPIVQGSFTLHLDSIPNRLVLGIGIGVRQDGFKQNIKIGHNCQGHWAIRFGDSNCSVEVGDNVIATHNECLLDGGAQIKIGHDCFFEGTVFLHAGDGHGIFDINSLQLLNYNKHHRITIENHVKVGFNCSILAGTEIKSGCVVEHRSVLRGSYPANAFLSGVSAKVQRENITWTHGRASTRARDVLHYLDLV